MFYLGFVAGILFSPIVGLIWLISKQNSEPHDPKDTHDARSR